MNKALIDSAVEAYRTQLDEKDIARLELFQGLWTIQDRHARAMADAAAYEVPDPARAEEWYWQEKPFFLGAPVKVDEAAYAAALQDIAAYLADKGGLKAEASEALRAFDWQALVATCDLAQAGYDPMAFIEACYMASIEAFEGERADEADTTSSEATFALPPEITILVLTYALRPLLQDAAAAVMKALAPALKEGNTIHDKPLFCPACGGKATAAFVGETPSSQGNGRLLYCATCDTEWEFERIRCAHCGTRNQGHLHYFHIEGDDAHRLHNCQECGDYMRTVFQEELQVPFSFEVEDVVMARLDMVAHDPRFEFDEEVGA